MIARILLVEDNPITRKVMRLALQAGGFEVVEAAGGEEAVACATCSWPDMILQDLVLGDVDGFALVARLRALQAAPNTPIVAISGLSGSEGKARSAGFTDFLLKPVEPSRLLEAVKLHLAGAQTVARAEATHIVVADDDPLQRKVIALGLERAGYRVSVASNGREALEIATSDRPAAIVTDLLMPVMDGLALCVALRRVSALAAIPVVLVTSGRLDEGDRELAVEAGAFAAIERTPGVEPVLGALRACLSRSPTAPLERAEPRQSQARLRAVKRISEEVAQRGELARITALWQATLDLLDRLAQGSSRLDDSGTAQVVLGSVLHAIGAPRGVIFGTDTDGTLSPRASLGYSAREQVSVAALFGEPALLRSAMDKEETVALVEEAGAPADVRRFLHGASASAAILMPLVAGGQRMGVIVAAHALPVLPPRWRELCDAMRTPIAQAYLVGRTVAQVAASEQRFRRIAESMGDGLLVASERGNILFANPAAHRILGIAPDLPERTLRDLLPFLDGRQDGQTGEAIRADGSRVPIETSTFVMREAGTLRRVVVARDLSDQRRMAELDHLAARDPLTSLYNRRRFDEELANHLAESRRHGTRGALLLFDLDRFKDINDTHGHAAGDAVLIAVARCLSESTRESDFVGRLGGDEFALLLPHTDGAGAATCARKIVERLAVTRVRYLGRDVMVGASFGVALYPEAADTSEALLLVADRALYAAKALGKSHQRMHLVARGDVG